MNNIIINIIIGIIIGIIFGIISFYFFNLIRNKILLNPKRILNNLEKNGFLKKENQEIKKELEKCISQKKKK